MHKNNKSNDQKIGILTYHFAYNCGAMLQAYALQKALSEKCDCEIIDYAPDYHTRQYVPKIRYYINSNNKKLITVIKCIPIGIYSYFKDNCHIRKHNYERFKQFIKKSKKITTVDQLKKITDSYDKILVGSDQIWKNTALTHSEYFLDLNQPAIKKYSYAASAGDCFAIEDIPVVKGFLSSFKHISVREKALADQLNEYGISCRVDVDPTLLLKKEDYTKLEKRVKIKGKFIFVYLCKDDRALSVIKHLSERLGAEVIFGPSTDFKSDIDFKYRFCDYFGPQEFLYCIHHASFVVTSSFHCTVFSILYNTPFVVFDKVGKFERIKDLLELTKLESHRFVSLNDMDFNSNYENAQSIIYSYAKSSYEYLNKIVCD